MATNSYKCIDLDLINDNNSNLDIRIFPLWPWPNKCQYFKLGHYDLPLWYHVIKRKLNYYKLKTKLGHYDLPTLIPCYKKQIILLKIKSLFHSIELRWRYTNIHNIILYYENSSQHNNEIHFSYKEFEKSYCPKS